MDSISQRRVKFWKEKLFTIAVLAAPLFQCFGDAETDIRLVAGRVRRVRDSENGWYRFWKVEVIQIINQHELLFKADPIDRICRLHYYPSTGGLIDGSKITFYAKEDGIYEYVSVLGAKKRTISFDYGMVPDAKELSAFTAEEQAAADRIAEEQRRLDSAAREEAKAQQRARALAREERAELAKERVVKFQLEQASRGLPTFQFDIGNRYLAGDGLPCDTNKAKFWFSQAAANGHSGASNALLKLR